MGILFSSARSLPRSDAFSISQPQYTVNDYGVNEFGDRQFSCTVVLPSASRVRVVTGREFGDRWRVTGPHADFEPLALCVSARVAKREAAFTACKVLRNVGSLDEHLLPLRTLPPEEVVEEGSAEPIGSKKRQVEYEHEIADVFIPRSPCSEETTFHLAALHFGGERGEIVHDKQLYRPLFLLTRNALPTLPGMTMFLQGESLEVFASPLGSVILTAAQRKTLAAFQVQLWQSILNKHSGSFEAPSTRMANGKSSTSSTCWRSQRRTSTSTSLAAKNRSTGARWNEASRRRSAGWTGRI